MSATVVLWVSHICSLLLLLLFFFSCFSFTPFPFTRFVRCSFLPRMEVVGICTFWIKLSSMMYNINISNECNDEYVTPRFFHAFGALLKIDTECVTSFSVFFSSLSFRPCEIERKKPFLHIWIELSLSEELMMIFFFHFHFYPNCFFPFSSVCHGADFFHEITVSLISLICSYLWFFFPRMHSNHKKWICDSQSFFLQSIPLNYLILIKFHTQIGQNRAEQNKTGSK